MTFAFAIAAVAAAAQAAPAQAPVVAAAEPTLEAVRAATMRFQDVNVALAEGYLRDPENICDTADMMGRPAADGAMGIHFFRPDLLGLSAASGPRVDGNGTHIDFLKPGVLIYEPQEDGSLELVAVENLVFTKAWHAAGNARPPSFQGVEFDLMADDPSTSVDEAHMFEPHYDRHVWLYRENPKGIFAQFNPNVSCKAHKAHAHKH